MGMMTVINGATQKGIRESLSIYPSIHLSIGMLTLSPGGMTIPHHRDISRDPTWMASELGQVMNLSTHE